MSESKFDKKEKKLTRRDFLKSSASAGLGIAMASPALAKPASARRFQEEKKPEELNVAVIGTGLQGRVLVESMLRIPEVRIRAICDIWEYSQQYASRYLLKYGQKVNVYEDYRDLLSKEKNLDAAVVASPDWVHAEHANACMQAGLHVYCEKEMSNSLAKAKTMAQTAKKTGKLLQIGHQRRSNPRYIHAIDKLIHEKKILGRVNVLYAQWNSAKSEMLGWPNRYAISQATLSKYGYRSMSEFRNWRWFKKYGGGPLVDLGSHQIDLFSWVLGTNPKSVVASGGTDYYKDRELYDNAMTIYEFDTESGLARALYQVQTTTKHGGFYEAFMGENGSIVLSEVPQRGDWAMREAHAPEWDSLALEGSLKSEKPKPAHQPHLENFFSAVLHGTPLSCPAEIGYESAVAVIKANEAVRARRMIMLRPQDFKA